MKKEMNPEGTIRTLHELIDTCHRGQQSFAEAAKAPNAAAIKDFCLEQSQMRGQFSADLREEMRDLDGDSKERGSFPAGRTGRAALPVTTGESDAILAACRKVNEAAIQQYEKALASPLPAPVRSVIEHQYRSIKQAHDQLK